MSEQSDQRRTCPTCGTIVPDGARYCPTCGTRLEAAAMSRTDFEDALDDVLDVPEEQPSQPSPPPSPSTDPDAPTTAIPRITAREPEPEPEPQQEWTATASDWSSQPPPQQGTWSNQQPQPGTWASQPTAAPVSSAPRGRRTMWIILAILGFIIFCCCGAFFGLLLIAESDTAFQEEVSRAALLWIE